MIENLINSDNALISNVLTKNRLDSLNLLKPGQTNVTDLTDSQRTDAEKAARGFESMFIHMLYKQMKTAMLDDPNNSEGLSFGADTLSGFTDLKFAEVLSKTGSGIGISDMIYKQLTGEKLNVITSHTKEIDFVPENLKPADRPIFEESKPEAKPQRVEKEVSKSVKQHFGSTFWERVQSRLNSYDNIIKEASTKFGVPEELIKSVITAESAGRPKAISSAGAKGLMQLMDGTALGLGVKDSFNPHQNITGGTKYLGQMLKKFDGDMSLALAAYNAGPGNVMKYKGIPPFKETQGYVKKVMSYINKYSEEINNQQ